MRTKHLFAVCLLLAATSAMAVPAYMHQWPKGEKALPMVIEDTFADWIVLSNYTGYTFLSMTDTTFHKISYPKEVAKLFIFNFDKDEEKQLLTLHMTGAKGKKMYDLTVDKDLNVVSCVPVTPPVDNNTKSGAPAENKIYTEDGKYYVTMKGNDGGKLKEELRTGEVKVGLYSADGTQLAEYAEEWTTPMNEYEVVQTILYQKDNKVMMNDNSIVYIMSRRRLDLGEGDLWKGFKDEPKAINGCDLRVVILKTNGEKRMFDLQKVDEKHYISNMYILNWEGDRLHMAGWYTNMDETSKMEGGFLTMQATPYVYQGVYSMIIDTKNEKVVKYEKGSREVSTSGLIKYNLVWHPFQDTEFSWFRFDDGWHFPGVGTRIQADAYVTDNGDVIIPEDSHVYSLISWDDEHWKTHYNPSNKTFIPFGFDKETQTYNFLVHDYDVNTGNGAYFRCIGKDRYLNEHVHWLIDNDTQPINHVSLRQKGGLTLLTEGIITDYSVHKLSENEALLFYIVRLKGGTYYFYEIQKFPDIRDIQIDENAPTEVSSEVQIKMKSVGKSLKSLLGKSLE